MGRIFKNTNSKFKYKFKFKFKYKFKYKFKIQKTNPLLNLNFEFGFEFLLALWQYEDYLTSVISPFNTSPVPSIYSTSIYQVTTP